VQGSSYLHVEHLGTMTRKYFDFVLDPIMKLIEDCRDNNKNVSEYACVNAFVSK